MYRDSKLGSKNLSIQAVNTSSNIHAFASMFWPGRALIKLRQQYRDYYTTGRTKHFVQPELHGEL